MEDQGYRGHGGGLDDALSRFGAHGYGYADRVGVREYFADFVEVPGRAVCEWIFDIWW